jgi:hypothetical protein
MHRGPNPGKIFELVQDELTIGRDISNRIVINDPEVSRKHSRLSLQSGNYVIEDLGSTNGTFVNGQRLIGPHVLRPGETVMLGEKIDLEYEVLGYDPSATLVSGSAPQVSPPVPPIAARETYRVESPEYAYPPAQPPVEPVQQPGYYQPPAVPAYQPPPPPPVYSGQVPESPVEPYAPALEGYEAPKKSRTWLYIGCGLLLVILCCVIAGLIAFDTANLYCEPPFDAIFTCP